MAASQTESLFCIAAALCSPGLYSWWNPPLGVTTWAITNHQQITFPVRLDVARHNPILKAEVIRINIAGHVDLGNGAVGVRERRWKLDTPERHPMLGPNLDRV